MTSAVPVAAPVGPLFDLVGRTPLIRLHRIERDRPGIELYAKAEFANPGGSVKDRPARRMLLEGLASGALSAGKVLLDATSGNTGIAYAMFGAALGVPVLLCVPDNVTAERKRMLRAYGAEFVLTNPLEGSDGAIREAVRTVDRDQPVYEIETMARIVEATLGQPVKLADIRRGDLIFWKGHVALARDAETMIHANAFHMAVAAEPIAEAITRIRDNGGEITSVKRL